MTPQQFHDLVLSFPHTELGTAHGEPAYRAFGKFLTRLRKEDDSVVLGQVPFDERDMLCGADPATFHFTPHYRNYPMVLARLGRLSAPQLRGYLTRQWRHNAPKKWLKAWHAGAELPPISAPRTAKKKAGPRRSGSRKTR